MKKYDSIDIAKFLGSILIFTMHLKPALAVQISARWAVPFFFICSSYFLFRKSKNKTVDRETIRKYIHRILTLYLVWFIFNIPSIIYTRLYGKDLSEIFSESLAFAYSSIVRHICNTLLYLITVSKETISEDQAYSLLGQMQKLFGQGLYLEASQLFHLTLLLSIFYYYCH